MHTHCKATHAHISTCLMHVFSRLVSLFAAHLFLAVPACFFWPRVRVRACSLFGEAVSMSERSERILTMSEALVLCCMSERSERIVSAEGTNPAAAKQRGLCLYKKNKELCY